MSDVDRNGKTGASSNLLQPLQRLGSRRRNLRNRVPFSDVAVGSKPSGHKPAQIKGRSRNRWKRFPMCWQPVKSDLLFVITNYSAETALLKERRKLHKYT